MTPKRLAPARITAALLRRHCACDGQVEKFEKEWPRGAAVTLSNVRRAIAFGFDICWAARKLLSSPARKAYDEEVAPARKAYDEAIARKAYDEEIAPARKAYDEEIAPARKAYGEAIEPARKAYDEAIATARKAYGEAIAPARKAYDEEIAPAFVKAWKMMQRKRPARRRPRRRP